jgi:hypothetical protein
MAPPDSSTAIRGKLPRIGDPGRRPLRGAIGISGIASKADLAERPSFFAD